MPASYYQTIIERNWYCVPFLYFSKLINIYIIQSLMPIKPETEVDFCADAGDLKKSEKKLTILSSLVE